MHIYMCVYQDIKVFVMVACDTHCTFYPYANTIEGHILDLHNGLFIELLCGLYFTIRLAVLIFLF